MKNAALLIALFVWFTHTTPAQQYRPINTNQSALFQNAYNKIIGLRIDSVKIESDTILFPFATIQDVSAEGCFSPNQASWMGEKVIIKPDGTNKFFNREGDTITLKTRARLDETWIAFQRADTFFVNATVHDIEFREFLGLTDSVKTISFRVTNKNGNTIDHQLNGMNVKISKNYGFVETLNFYLFPDLSVRLTGDRLGKYTLAGLTNPDAGIQNLKWFEVFDFNTGDELHIRETRTGDPQFSSIIEYEKKTIFNYLQRTDYNDSIIYRCSRKQSIETVYSDSTSLVINNDTVQQVIYTNPDFDKLPGEPVIDSGLLYSFYMENGEFLKKIDQLETQQFELNGGCWNLVTGEGCSREMNYFDGLGGPYYSCTGYVGDSEERKLVYFKKDETEWGEQLLITNISDIRNEEIIHVYPNPANDELNVFLKSNNRIYKIELFNLTGNCIYQNHADMKNSFKLNISEFSKGVYILKVETENGELSKQVVIQ